jgi:ABC-type transport system involved in multi-copper enzyme maturation permease subunit
LLAVLKDSFREAIDFKVFYVMLLLSGALILFVAGISFSPDQPDEMMKFLSLSLNGDLLEALQGRKSELSENRTLASYLVKTAEPADTTEPTPGSTYRITLKMQVANAQERAKVIDDPQPTIDFIQSRFASGDDVQIYKVSDVKLIPAPPDEPAGNPVQAIYFEFLAHPTSITHRIWPHRLRLFGAKIPFIEDHAVPLGFELWAIEDILVNGWGAAVAILISVIVTSMFIPNMIQKGTIDMLLVKPISRPLLLIYKYLGGLIFMLLNTAFVVTGMWIVLGLRSGIWSTGFLLTILVMTFSFAILYAVSALCGVLTRSAIVSILVTCVVWAGLFAVGKWYVVAEGLRIQEVAMKKKTDDPIEQQWWYRVPRLLHLALPRYKEIDELTSRFLMMDLLTANQIKEQKLPSSDVNWGTSVSVSLVFIGFMLGLACWRFSTRDY